MAPTFPIGFTGQKEPKKCLHSQMGKTRNHSKEHTSDFISDYRHAVETVGESEGLWSSRQVEAEMSTSDNSSAPKRKCIGLNTEGYDSFGVPIHALSLSKMSRFERNNLQSRLKVELEKIRALQQRVASFSPDSFSLPPSAVIGSSSAGQKQISLENIHRLNELSAPQGNFLAPPSQKEARVKKSTSGRVNSFNTSLAANTSNALLMKQCDTLLSALLSHKCSWVFKSPVDAVTLNIPDYFTIIKHPMDLGTIRSKIAKGEYSSPLAYAADVRLTFANAMTYNPPGNNVHVMAKTMSKYFEQKWKAIEKKLPAAPDVAVVPLITNAYMETETIEAMPPLRRNKVKPVNTVVRPEPLPLVMSAEAKDKLSTELEGLLEELPEKIIDFLKEYNSSTGQTCDDEIEVDINALDDNTLHKLRKLLDDHLLEKRKTDETAKQGTVEVLHESMHSHSSQQPMKAEVDIVGGNDATFPSHISLEKEKQKEKEKERDEPGRNSKSSSPSSSSGESGSSSSDVGSSPYSKSNEAKFHIPFNMSKETEDLTSGVNPKLSTSNAGDAENENESSNGLGKVSLSSHDKPVSVVLDSHEHGGSPPPERKVSPEKLYRAALLRNRFADVILKAREKAFEKGDKLGPDKLQIDRDELERQQKEEKARLQAEARAAEEAQRKAAAEAAAEVRRNRELEREAARVALQKMEKTVDINENSEFLEDLEMLKAPNDEHATSFMDTSPDISQIGFGSFNLLGSSNPLEQLGLYRKDEEDEEDEVQPPLILPHPANDAEDGEID